MTDQKPPVPAAKPVAPQSTASKPPMPAPAQKAAPVVPPVQPKPPGAPVTPPTPPRPTTPPPSRPAAPPLPKPNFSVTTPGTQPAQQAPKPPVAQTPPKPPAPPAPKPAGTPPRPSNPGQPAQAPRPPVAATAASPGGAKPLPVPADVRPPASTIRQAPRPTGVPQPGVPAGMPPVPGALPGQPPGPRPVPPAKGTAPLKPATAPQSASQPPAGQTPPAPKAAEYKKSPLRFLPLIVGLLVVVGVVAFLFNRFFGARTPTATPSGTQNQTQTQPETVITYWGLWEPTPVLEAALAEFESQNPGVRVNYQQQTYRDYRERLQTAIASGRGPDVFRYHASWVPMLRAELDPMPNTVYTPAEFQTIFFPIVSKQLDVNGRYVGVPLMYEGLALLYNQEVFDTANVQPPKTWAELRDLAVRLTIRNNDRIQRAGLAIGNAANVDNFSDILGLLMLQNGADPTNPTSQQAMEAIQFYTDFYTKSRVWDETLPNSTVAFARGDVAMILAPSWRIHEIKNQNPNITIGVAPVPQLGDNKITWASYWVEGVSAQSRNKEAAWALLKYLSSQEALQLLHSDASKERSFGEIYPRVDMANLLADSPYAAAYLADAPYAQDWYMNSFTHDNGLNDQIIKYYQDALTSSLSGSVQLDKAIQTVSQGLLQILRQYNLVR